MRYVFWCPQKNTPLLVLTDWWGFLLGGNRAGTIFEPSIQFFIFDEGHPIDFEKLDPALLVFFIKLGPRNSYVCSTIFGSCCTGSRLRFAVCLHVHCLPMLELKSACIYKCLKLRLKYQKFVPPTRLITPKRELNSRPENKISHQKFFLARVFRILVSFVAPYGSMH